LHELSIALSLLDLALKHASHAGAKRITDLHLVIGDLSSVVDDSLQFHWGIIAEDTPAQGARLHFDRRPTLLQCTACDHHFAPQNGYFGCPECGSLQVHIIQGDEFLLEAIEVE
jgi:hydrogenase nickel incorporation protein HypA/HybF